MASPLQHVPGLAGYLQQQQMAQQQETGQLQQFGQVMGLRNALAQQEMAKRAMALKEAEAQRGAGAGQPIGAGGLRLPDGTIVAPVARPEQPTVPKVVQLQEARKRYLASGVPENSPLIKQLDAAISKETTPSAGVSVYSGSPVAGVDAQGNPVFFQPSAQPGVPPKIISGVKPAPKPGNEVGLTPENAGKVAMSRQAIQAVNTVRGLLFDKGGNLNRGLLLSMAVPGTTGLPGDTNARVARSAIRNAVEAKLRLETGAAATEDEINRTLDRFMPTVGDTKESATFKLRELEKFFNMLLSQTKGMKDESNSKPQRLKFDAQGNPIQ